MEMNTLHLEQIHLGELKFPESTDLSKKQKIQSLMSDLDKSDSEILAAHPVEVMKAAVMARLAANAANKEQINNKSNSNVFPWHNSESEGDSGTEKTAAKASPFVRFFTNPQRIVIVAAAACFALAIPVLTITGLKFGGATQSDGSTVSIESVADETRVKGNGSRLYIYRKKGLEAIKLSANSKVAAGDTLQLSYIAAGAKYGAILSIDGNGTITQHFPYGSEQCEELKKDGEVALDYSYLLDDAPSFERFLLITSTKPFSTQNLVDTLEKANQNGYSETIETARLQNDGITITDMLLLK